MFVLHKLKVNDDVHIINYSLNKEDTNIRSHNFLPDICRCISCRCTLFNENYDEATEQTPLSEIKKPTSTRSLNFICSITGVWFAKITIKIVSLSLISLVFFYV